MREAGEPGMQSRLSPVRQAFLTRPQDWPFGSSRISSRPRGDSMDRVSISMRLLQSTLSLMWSERSSSSAKMDSLTARSAEHPRHSVAASVKTEHGAFAAPAPATLDILSRHRIAWSAFPSPDELTTPTGAALLANLAGTMTEIFPAMTPVRVGYGIGSRTDGGNRGALRVVEGRTFRAISDRIIMLETNLDDISGEAIGYTYERLREAGAVDVFITPALGKKNRPVHVVHVICRPEGYEGILAILMEETGTLGVRVLDQPRLVALEVE